ncbi:MAG TPA: tetratricopeptide repeat protein [Bacteroidota bacterium]|nr:tetratricopeptide repeat protein [Bacteroidota bacterium]
MQPHRRKESSRLTAQRPPRGKAFYFVSTLLIPFLLFAALEATLRIFHYGPDLSLFTTEEIAGRTYHIMNPDVKNRYFSHVEFSPNTSPDYFLAPKPQGAFRIFCLGGSTTVGYPYGYVASFSTFLRDRLRTLFPERNIEIINLGLTATNSFTAVDIASEIVGYEPDLVIVYDGHNEFYGALGIASHESIGSARWLIKSYLRLVHFRSFILIRTLIRAVSKLFGPGIVPDQTGTMMERLARGQYIPYRGAVYRSCLSNFIENLQELKSICSGHRVALLLSSQVSNLRNRPPFISGRRGDLSGAEAEQLNGIIRLAEAHLRSGRADSALALFESAARIDSMNAGVRYGIAQCFDTLGRRAEARREYISSRDLDELRFRASSDFNDAIRSQCVGTGAFFADIEGTFARSSPNSMVGTNLILEHLHPNMRGYFLMAKEYARSVREHELLCSMQEWDARDTVGDERLWQRRPATELDELCAARRMETLTSSWPFGLPSKEPHTKNPSDPMGHIVERMVMGVSTWEEGHVAAARVYESGGQWDRAEKEYRALINQFPLNSSAYLILGQLYVRRNEPEKARLVLEQSLAVEKTRFAEQALGAMRLNADQPNEAIPFLEGAVNLSHTVAERSESGYVLALAYYRSGMKEQAVEQLTKVLQDDPKHSLARGLLARINRMK